MGLKIEFHVLLYTRANQCSLTRHSFFHKIWDNNNHLFLQITQRLKRNALIKSYSGLRLNFGWLSQNIWSIGITIGHMKVSAGQWSCHMSKT